MQVHAGEGLKQAQPGCSLPSAPSARHEYSSMDVTLEVVPDMAAAIDHIHANGSGHTGLSQHKTQTSAGHLQLSEAVVVTEERVGAVRLTGCQIDDST